jgi:hypothetical protein
LNYFAPRPPDNWPIVRGALGVGGSQGQHRRTLRAAPFFFFFRGDEGDVAASLR